MKKMPKLLLAMVVLFFATGFILLPSANASEYLTPADACFDLNDGPKQERTIELPDGSTGVFGIEKEQADVAPIWDGYYNATDGNWMVYFYTGVLDAEYWISIKNYNITSWWGHKASSVGAALSNFSKSFSSKRTKWSFLFTGVGGMASATYTLGAEINGSRLHTYLA